MNRNIIYCGFAIFLILTLGLIWSSEPIINESSQNTSNDVAPEASKRVDGVANTPGQLSAGEERAIAGALTQKDEPTKRAYKATIVSTLSNGGQSIANFTNSIQFEVDIARDQKGLSKGVAYAARFESEDPETEIPEYLGFTFQYVKGAFDDVSLLGLDPQHPLNIIGVLLTQLSYYSGVKSVELPDGLHTYVYSVSGNSVSRSKVNDVESAASYETLEDEEFWTLTLDAHGFPSSLDTRVKKKVRMDDTTLLLSQQITVHPIPLKQDIFLLASFNANANKTYRVALASDEPELEITDSNFMEILVSFDARPTLATAKVLGVYLVNRGWGFIRELLTADDVSDSMRSSIIFALERSGEREAEYHLASIIEDESLGETDRLRAMMSIAKMGDINSQAALTTLQNMLDNKNSLLAETALLNIGILGKQNPIMSAEVASFLSQRLTTQGAGYGDLLATSNFANPELDQDVLPYLNSQYADERQVAATMLSKNPEMQSTLLEKMLQDGHPSVVKAISQGIEASGAKVDLSESYQAELRTIILSPEALIPTRELLFSFLANNSQPSTQNKSLAQQLLGTPELSESTRVLAQELLTK